MRTAIILLALFCLTSCACVSKPPRNPSDPSPRNTNHVTVSLELNLGRAYPGYDILLRFTNHSDYTHLVQEIEMENGWCLVECFRIATGRSIYDHHAGAGWRRMRLYPANVVGALEPWGFAHLQQNQDGSMVTKIPVAFNVSYRAVCGDGPWPGVIVKQSPETAALWRVTPDDALHHIEVWTGDGITFLTQPK